MDEQINMNVNMNTNMNFRKSVEEIQVSVTHYKNNGYFTRRRMSLYNNISFNSPQNKKYFKQNS